MIGKSLKERISERLIPNLALLNRDITLSKLPHLSTMLNLEKAARMLISSIEDGDKILIVGDYDADGILGTSLLYGFLCDIGLSLNINYIIPSRLVDGYGLTENIINFAIDNCFDTIVTVDNGISAVEPIKKAKENGLKVIITDHHTAPAILPDADVIVNPKQPGETFEFINISGATVAWYFAYQIKTLLNLNIDMRNYLDLAGLTVVSDVMPLTHMNLAILNFTLNKIRSNRKFRYIYELCWSEERARVVNETSIGFDLVPMINAIGRIDDANKAVKMFLSRDKNEINSLFEEVKAINKDRKEKTFDYLEIAPSEIDFSKKAIVIKNEFFHEGIVGIIAGKLAEKYRVPAYVFGWNEKKGLWKGSGRSVGNIHLYDLTNKASSFSAGFGGHKGAVGIGIKKENFDSFKKTIEDAAALIPDIEFHDISTNPIPCTLDELSLDVLTHLESFGPFGEMNRLPMFLAENVEIYPEREVSGGKHFETKIKQGNVIMKAMFFHIQDKESFLNKIKEKRSILFTLNKNYNIKRDVFNFEVFAKLAD